MFEIGFRTLKSNISVRKTEKLLGLLMTQSLEENWLGLTPRKKVGFAV